MMGFWWEDDAATLASSGRVAYYNCYYTQDSVTKEFTVTRSAGLVVSMQETAVSTAKNVEDVVPVAEAPTEPPPEVPAVEAAPAEVAPEVTPETPAVEAAPEAPAPEAVPAPDVAPEAPVVEATAVEPTTKVADVLASLVAIGKSFEVDVSAEGKTTIRVVEKSVPASAPPPAAAAPETTEIERMRQERDSAIKAQDEMRKQLAKTLSDDPPTGQEIGVQRDNQQPPQQLSYLGQMVAAGIAQTRTE
jgi:hypothetical protein